MNNNIDEIEVLRNILNRDPVKNLSITGFMNNNNITRIIRSGESICITGISDNEWAYFSIAGEKDLYLILDELRNKIKYFASVEDWMIPVMTKGKEIDWILTTMRYYFPKEIFDEKNDPRLEKLNEDDAGFIIEQSDYKNFLSAGYIKDRIKRSYSACIRENGKLTAWGLTHDDGALGSLHVLREHRKKGFAKAILISLMGQCLEDKKIPYAQVEEKNKPAINLIKKLGFVEDRRVTWIKLK